MRSSCLALIPVRGGSKTIPRKNARLLAGRPLLSHTVTSALEAGCFSDVVVSTDDEELAWLAEKAGARVVMRDAGLARDDVGLDEVIVNAVEYLEADGSRFDYVATIQATSPLLTPATMRRAVSTCDSKGVDTVMSVVEDTHLGWSVDDKDRLRPDHAERLNRQYLPVHYRETGGIVVCTRRQLARGTRFGKRIEPIVLDKREGIDIDDRFDWWLAEKQLERKRVVFRVEGYAEIGLGHVYRCLTLADRMLDHDVAFVTSARSRVGTRLLKSRFYPVATFGDPRKELDTIAAFEPDIVVNDILDTDAGYVWALKKRGWRVVNFEDQGSGHLEADAVVNAMYRPSSRRKHVYTGPAYACLRDEFYGARPIEVRKQVEHIVVLFGGVDPSGLTRRVVKWLQKDRSADRVTVIVGAGYSGRDRLAALCGRSDHMKMVSDTRTVSRYMADADIAVTSAGRTVFELAHFGIPMIVMCQNERELTHALAKESKGLVNLGLGRDVEYDRFAETLEGLMPVATRRRMNRALRSNDFERGVGNVWKIIEGGEASA